MFQPDFIKISSYTRDLVHTLFTPPHGLSGPVTVTGLVFPTAATQLISLFPHCTIANLDVRSTNQNETSLVFAKGQG